MAAENNVPDEVRIKDVKRLDSSLTLKRNRPQLESVINQLQQVVRNEELQSGLVVRIPLDSDRNLHELTVSHYSRDGVPKEEQDESLYWSDYAAILLDLAQKFKNTSLRDEFSQYGPTKSHLEQWVSSGTKSLDVVDELSTWEHRHEIAELAAKIIGAFAVGNIVETETENASAGDDQEQDKLTKAQAEAIAEALIPGSNEPAATTDELTNEGADTSSTTAAEPVLQPNQQIDSSRPLTEQLSAEQRRQYGISVGWMTSFTLLQIADSMGVNIQDLDPSLRAQLTDYATQYLEKDGDLAALLAGSPTARLKAIRGLTRLLREKNFYEKNNVKLFGEIYTSNEILEHNLHDILKDKNSVVDKNIEKIIEDIVITRGEKAIPLINSFDKSTIEIIFGLQAYALTDAQVTNLKNTLISYAEVRLAEVVLHTQDEKNKQGLAGEAELNTKDSLELAGAVRSAITTHSSENKKEGELVADALTTTSDKTSQKIKSALQQNEKIFGNTWRALKPEEQADALRLLGLAYLIPKDGKHPVEGYALPINIAEINTQELKKYRQLIIEEQRLTTEAQLEELQIAIEMNEYVVAIQRAESLSLELRYEYLSQIEQAQVALLHEQQALDQQSLQQLVFTQTGQSTEPREDQEVNSTDVASAAGTFSKVKGALGAVSKNPAASKMRSAAAKKIAEKLAMGTGVGTAVVVGAKVLNKVIGEENTKKIGLILGGLAAGTVGALIIKTMQALQTVGGAIGGFLGGIGGFIVGGPAGAALGVIGGANAGAAAQNWLLGLFGKGTATGSSLGGAGMSAPSFGASSLFSGGAGGGATSAASSAIPTIAQGSNAIIQGTGNAVQAVTTLGQQAAATTAAAPAAAVAGVKSAAAATGTFLTSLPVIAVGFGALFPGFMTFVVFIIIMGAFLVPMPFTISKGTPTVSQYATIVKTPTPSEIDNDVEKDITYDIRINPKPGYSLQIKRVTDEFLILGGDATVPDSPLTIDAFSQEKFSTIQTAEYTLPISGKDALVINTVTFVVDVYDGSGKLLIQGESISALGLLIIGDPPIGCFDFAPAGLDTDYTSGGQTVTNTSLEWTQDDIVKFLRAFINRVGTNPQFLSLACEDGDISLHKWPSNPNGYWGWKVNNDKLGFYGDFFNGSPSSMEYTVVHELGHIIDGRNNELQPAFKAIQTAPVAGDSGCFTYPFPAMCSEGEAFAEAIADYVVWQTHSFNNQGWTGMFPFKTRYPVEYSWVQMNIFGGIEY